MKGIEKAGGIPLMLPLTDDSGIIEQLVSSFDGFLLTGGHDVSPELYFPENPDACGESCALRDRMELLLLDFALKADKPIFGICRGIQLLNVYLGGTLYCDLPTEYKSGVVHSMQPPYDRTAHYVKILESTPLFDLLKIEKLGVNSYHHQAIKELSPRLLPMAYSEDGLVEAVYMPERSFVRAVQWHPELSYQSSAESMALLRDFTKAARK